MVKFYVIMLVFSSFSANCVKRARE